MYQDAPQPPLFSWRQASYRNSSRLILRLVIAAERPLIRGGCHNATTTHARGRWRRFCLSFLRMELYVTPKNLPQYQRTYMARRVIQDFVFSCCYSFFLS